MSPADRRVELATALTGAGAPGAELRRLLDGTLVTVQADRAGGPAAVLAAAALASLCARVVGRVHVPPWDMPRPNPWGARTLPGVVGASRLSHPAARALVRPTEGIVRTIEVVVGAGDQRDDRTDRTDRDGRAIWAGGDDWTAIVSRDGPAPVGQCRLGGLGLQAAAALAFGEVLKDLLAPVGMRCLPVQGTLVWNLLDGRLAPASVPPVSGPIAPPLVAFLGAGSVGSSAGALLSLTPVIGIADVVDPDRFLPVRNAYRCPAVAAGESGPKVRWLARVLRQAGWGARPDRRRLAQWAADRRERGDAGYDGIALVTVDNVEARRDAAELQAATTLTAGVAGAALHVHRHQAGDGLACPYCELVDASHWREQAEAYARLTGLTATRVLELLNGATLTADDVGTAVWAGCVEPWAVDQLTQGSARLADLVAHHYAAVALRAGRPDPARLAAVAPGRAADVAAPPPAAQAVSAPHVSWLAGTLLAAEVVKAALGLPGLDRRVELDLTGIPRGGWRRPARDSSGRCLCASPARRHLARALYDSP